MDSSTTISQMFSGNTLYVPTYQRAYSWDTGIGTNKMPKQVNQFIIDLQDYVASASASKYYFGHFLFERKSDNCFAVIDGQQRLTTITIFIAALFERLKQIRSLDEEELLAYMNIIKVGATYRFSTVEYDDQLFRDYVINHIKIDSNGLSTESQKRIVAAYEYFKGVLSNMSESEICMLKNAVINASCTTHIVNNEAEAIQMFIFQNNRGKKPSNLEIIKAQFMYNIHLYGGTEAEKQELINEIKNRFNAIYESISRIEHRINEDNILSYAQKIYFNILPDTNVLQYVNLELEKDTRIDFIRNFTRMLAASFEQTIVFLRLEKEWIEIHSLYLFANRSIMMPFMIKALMYNVNQTELIRLAASLESIFIRDKVIGTRADLTQRLKDVFQEFRGDVNPIIIRIEWMKTREDWWGYWNNSEFNRTLQGWIRSDIAKLLLWKYENHLIEEGKFGYCPIRYDNIIEPQLEHVAPKTENPANGYCEYDEDFMSHYLENLGNYLLLSASHNISIGNIAFEAKRSTYTQLRQQQEVRDMTESDHYWDKEKISKRKSKIINYLLRTF